MTMLSDDADVTDLRPLRYVRSITAPLSPLQARRFHDKFGVAVLNCYGQTEIGGEIVGWNAADWREFGRVQARLGRPTPRGVVRASTPPARRDRARPASCACGRPRSSVELRRRGPSSPTG